MTSVYLETSALLRMLFGEQGAGDVARRLRAATRVVASRLVRVETERALIRLNLEQPATDRLMPEVHRDLRNLWARVDFMEITEAVCALAGRIAPSSHLRTLDAIHLATFRQLKGVEPDLTMLTFDDRLQREL